MLENIVQVPYLTSAKMQRCSNLGFNLATSYSIQAKKHELSKYNEDLYGCLNADIVQAAANILELNPVTDIVDLALKIQEDLAIMHNGVLAAICFCYPSSWVPSEKLGLNFLQIHNDVADNQKLLEAGERIMKTITTTGPFRRYVWTITNNSALSNHPKSKLTATPNSIEELYFRYETQTTVPMPNYNAAMLLVNVTVEKLSTFWDRLEHRKLILDSINSMTNTILTYKNLHHIKRLLNNDN